MLVVLNLCNCSTLNEWYKRRYYTHAGYLVSVRLDYIAISDPRASRYWLVRQWDAGRTTLFPPPFYQEGYLDKCSAQNEYDADDIKDNLDDFERISGLLASETEVG